MAIYVHTHTDLSIHMLTVMSSLLEVCNSVAFAMQGFPCHRLEECDRKC